MGYPFGADFSYSFDLQVDGITIPNGFAPDAPTIYIFTSKPSRSQAIAGTGAIQTISSWTRIGNIATFGVLAIDDPDPTGGVDKRTYWIGINLYAQAAEQQQLILKSLELERVKVAVKGLTLLPSSLEEIHPGLLGPYYTAAQMLVFINIARTHVQATLANKGFDWALLNCQEDLNQVVAFKALVFALAGQRQSQGDRFDVNIKMFEDLYAAAFAALQFEYDADSSGEPDAVKSTIASGLISR